MNLEQAVSILDGKELDGVLAHWNFDRQAWPVTAEERRVLLLRHLRDRRSVNERLSTMPSRLRELLIHVVRSRCCKRPLDVRDFDTRDLPIESFEVLPVAMALAERGFLLMTRVRTGSTRSACFQMPDEIASILEEVLEMTRKPIDAALSLGSWLRFVGRSVCGDKLEELGMGEHRELGQVELRALLSEPRAAMARIERIEDSEFRAMVAALAEHGGVIDAETRRRFGFEAGEKDLDQRGALLEDLLIGTFECAELANLGLSCREGWLVVFHEIVSATFEAREAAIDPDLAGAEMQRAPEPIAELQRVVEALEESPVKLKKGGEYPKSGIRKLTKAALAPGERGEEGERHVEWLLDFLVEREFLTPGVDGRLRSTRRWRDHTGLGADEKSNVLLEHVVASPSAGFSVLHHFALRKALLGEIADGGLRRWRDLAALVMRARNRVLREAVRPEQAQRYQERHKHAPFPALATPDAMQRALYNWTIDELSRTGLVEFAWREGESRPWAMRATKIGAVGFGLKDEDRAASGDGLVVSADLEIVIFPEFAAPDVAQEVGRFATRQKADYALHYLMTRESVQAAAARGQTAEEMLALLRTHSRHEIPAIVDFSVREWVSKVVRLDRRRSWLLEASTKEALDRALQLAELSSLVHRRLTDTIVELNEDPAASGIVTLLKDRAVYL